MSDSRKHTAENSPRHIISAPVRVFLEQPIQNRPYLRILNKTERAFIGEIEEEIRAAVKTMVTEAISARGNPLATPDLSDITAEIREKTVLSAPNAAALASSIAQEEMKKQIKIAMGIEPEQKMQR